MKIKGGYNKKILNIDLSKNKVVVSRVNDAFALKYIGGRGYGARLVWDNLGAKLPNALEPRNVLVIAPGPLTGAYLPASCKTSFVSISPATGIYGDSSMGGMFGIELKQAGYDALVLRGALKKLSYIWIDDDTVEIKDAKKYAGKGCTETERELKKDIGDESIRVSAIGPAGEKLVRYACVNTEWSRNAGRCGMGTILGSKKVKAIAVRGTKDLPIYDLDALIGISNRAYAYLASHPLFEFWQQQGLMSVIDYANTSGVMPTYNFRDGVFSEADKINGEQMLLRYKIGDTACYACPMACGNICLVKQGKYAGTVTEGPEYETACMFGPNVGVGDFSAILRANYLCDEFGIDTITTANLIGVMIEGYEQGIVTKKELDGLTPRWGDDVSILTLVEKIANRDGVGNILADGSIAVLSKWPKLRPILSQVKGLEQSAYDARVAMTMALAYATCDVGAHHNRAWPIAKELEMGANWSIEQKVDLVVYHQTIRPLFDMLGVCRLQWIELGIDEKFYAEMYSAVTGVKAKLEDLLENSRAVYNLTRAISVRYGIRRKDDYPPERVFNTPIKTGPHAGKVLNRELYEKVLDLYYKKRDWDKNGVPTKEELKKSGLEDVARVLKV
jgi:aldehyde:ferredoxin oxidoreductase